MHDMQSIQFYNAFCGQKSWMKRGASAGSLLP